MSLLTAALKASRERHRASDERERERERAATARQIAGDLSHVRFCRPRATVPGRMVPGTDHAWGNETVSHAEVNPPEIRGHNFKN